MSSKPNVLITGVGQRIGLHLARSMLARGFHVIGTFRTDRPAIEELRSQGVELHQIDFYESGSAKQLVKNIQASHTTLRAIIHNASEWLTDSTDSEVDVLGRMFDIHVRAPYELNSLLIDLLIASDSEFADIIHFSDHVVSTGSAKHTAYAASKAAIDNLTLSFAAKYAPKVKVNSIAPGLILFNEQDSYEYKEKTLKKALIPREGGVDEISETVFYLLNSRYVTGRVMAVDGGRHIAHKAVRPQERLESGNMRLVSQSN